MVRALYQLARARPTAAIAFVLVSLSCPVQALPRPVIADDDGSADGMIALICLLQDPGVDVRAVTVAQGLAHPDVFAPFVRNVLARLGRPDIPVAAGRLAPLRGHNAFPHAWRGDSDRFWGLALPDVTQPAEPLSAAELIVRTVRNSRRSVSILATGPLTNVAEALRHAPDIAHRIRLVEVMGGAVWVPGNVGAEWPEIDNKVAEWNVWIDPTAAREVIRSGVPVRFMPLDATNRMVFTAEDAAAWRASGTPGGELSAELLDYLLAQISPDGVSVWDAVAAMDLLDPSKCAAVRVHLDVQTQPGPKQGWTRPRPEQKPNCEVCRRPMARQIRAAVRELMARVP